MDPRYLHQKINPQHYFFEQNQKFLTSHYPCQNLTHATHEPTHLRYPRHPRYLADSLPIAQWWQI